MCTGIQNTDKAELAVVKKRWKKKKVGDCICIMSLFGTCIEKSLYGNVQFNIPPRILFDAAE